MRDPGDDSLGTRLILSEPQAAGGVVTIRARGDLDVVSSWQVRRHVLAAARGCRSVVLDLSGISFIDSSGLGLLTGLTEELAGRSIALRLGAPSLPVQRLLRLTGLGNGPLLVEPSGGPP